MALRSETTRLGYARPLNFLPSLLLDLSQSLLLAALYYHQSCDCYVPPTPLPSLLSSVSVCLCNTYTTPQPRATKIQSTANRKDHKYDWVSVYSYVSFPAKSRVEEIRF